MVLPMAAIYALRPLTTCLYRILRIGQITVVLWVGRGLHLSRSPRLLRIGRSLFLTGPF